MNKTLPKQRIANKFETTHDTIFLGLFILSFNKKCFVSLHPFIHTFKNLFRYPYNNNLHVILMTNCSIYDHQFQQSY